MKLLEYKDYAKAAISSIKPLGRKPVFCYSRGDLLQGIFRCQMTIIKRIRFYPDWRRIFYDEQGQAIGTGGSSYTAQGFEGAF
jgi:hypothetical protein